MHLGKYVCDGTKQILISHAQTKLWSLKYWSLKLGNKMP